MKTNYYFESIYGSLYHGGNMVFSKKEQHSLYSPIGNRVSCFDLKSSKCFTFNHENRIDASTIAVSPSNHLLITIDKNGHALLLNVYRRTLIGSHHFKGRVHDLQFAPHGQSMLVTLGHHLQLWKTPGGMRAFQPMVLLKTYTGALDDVTQVCWRKDAKVFVASSKDMNARVYTVDKIEGYSNVVLSGHTTSVIGAWFSKDGTEVYTISYDGALFHWTPTQFHSEKASLPLTYQIKKKHFFNQPKSRVSSTAFHVASSMNEEVLAIGFTTGVFGIWLLPAFQWVHTLSFTTSPITTLSFSNDGAWLALGCKELHQAMVWEWSSETYIVKHQGHTQQVNHLAWSNQCLATASDDHKIKLWNDQGVCFVTFDVHTAPVQALTFTKQGQVLLSASLDGSVRAFDTKRYRNFKTYTTPTPVQFSALTVDVTGDLVAAGGKDVFDIFIWSLQTGKLMESLSGHTGPISDLAFAGNLLVSGSWDQTVRSWQVFDRSLAMERFQHTSEVLAMTVSPDTQVVASATLDGMITFWDLLLGQIVNVIEGRRDVRGGRGASDLVTSKHNGSGHYFTTLTYTSDGQCILAGGVSNDICLYHVATSTLLRRFTLSHHRGLDGVLDKLNSKRMTEAGALDTLEVSDSEEDHELTKYLVPKKGSTQNLPGATRGDLSERSTRPKIQASCVRFSTTGRKFAVASTLGVVLFSMDHPIVFDPLDLDLEVTPMTIQSCLSSKQYSNALFLAFRLNERPWIHHVVTQFPASEIPLLCMDFPTVYLPSIFQFLATYLTNTQQLELALMWCFHLLLHHADYCRTHLSHSTDLRAIKKVIAQWQSDLSKLYVYCRKESRVDLKKEAIVFLFFFFFFFFVVNLL
ncbi:hypothetical protein HMI54_003244 [Coelomomyces lativittatus]|nr:hypothetical protein HMI54_003244 [Coelomomyces lativittatus]